MEKLNGLLDDFSSQLNSRIEKTWAIEDIPKHLEEMAEDATAFSKQMVEIGDYGYRQFSLPSIGDTTIEVQWYILNYAWSDCAKSFLILWRDVLFQEQKAHILYLDEQIDESVLLSLKEQSKQTVLRALKTLIQFFPNELNSIKKRNAVEKSTMKWRLQQNPWLTYKEQIETLGKQSTAIYEQHQKLMQTGSHFHNIRGLIENTIKGLEHKIEDTKKLAQRTIDFVTENIETKPTKIDAKIGDLIADIKPTQDINNFSLAIKEKLEPLEKVQVLVGTREGVLQYKEVNFKQSTHQWLDAEVLPVLYEIWELTDNVNNGMKMALLNIRNRVSLLLSETKDNNFADFGKEDVAQSLSAFLNKATGWETELTEFKDLIKNRLETSFRINAIYGVQHSFLPVRLQSTINQLKINQYGWVIKGQNWIKERQNYFQKIRDKIQQNSSLSDSERIVQFVQYKTVDPENYHYSSIFLTKGYIGESFWVGRKQELLRIEKLIKQWRIGFRGAVILKGQRFSGKSLFGELVAHRYFSSNTIRLSPNSTIDVHGRRLTIRYDLEEALDFIHKNTLNTFPLVWLDDLELWSSPHISLNQNVRKLCQYIDKHSKQIFFLVSMGNALNRHLTQIQEIDKVFQTEISLDHMSLEEIRQAILIRHGATHKTLVDKKGVKTNPQQFKKTTLGIYNKSDGNIGEALNQWSFLIEKFNEEKVNCKDLHNYTLPNFVNSDSRILLSTIMILKRTNEYRLNKLFGSPFQEKYINILQRLLSLGLLTRHLDGWLEINAAVVNDIEKLL